MAPIRILVADDHAVLREGICALVSQQPDMDVVGGACNGIEAIEQVTALKPDVVLMDISMPEMDGLEATRKIKELAPQTRVLILTQHENKEYILSVLQAGAAGYLLKKAGGAELLNAIRAVISEGVFLNPSIASTLMNQIIQSGARGTHLTDREKQVLRLIVEGLSSREIAAQLCVSEKTVLVHRNNLMGKLDIHNRAELVRYAIREGFIKP